LKSTKITGLLALIAAAALAATAALAAVSAAPDAAQMALQAADIPNSRAKGKRIKPDAGYVAAYEREFELSKPYGPSQLLYVSSEVALAPTSKTTKTDMAGLRKFLGSKRGRQLLADSMRQELGATAKKQDVTIGKLRTPPIGDESVLLPLTIRTKAGRFHSAISWFRVDRTRAFLVVVGLRPVGPAEVGRLGAMVVAHVGEQFTPVATAPPAIAGTPQLGQTLTLSAATFNTAATLSHAWQRCDPAGAACVDIVGATSPTYVVVTEDVGTTLRGTVTGTNRFGAGSSQSVQTTVVTQESAPSG
jgi:hypothetical protein